MNSHLTQLAIATLTFGASLAAATPAAAAQTTGYAASEAYNLGTDVPLLSPVLNLLGLNPLNYNAGVAPNAYAHQSSVLDLGISPILSGPNYRLQLSSATLSSGVGSSVDGSAGPHTTSAWTRTEGLSVNFDQFFSSLILGIDAGVMTSTAQITGQPGSFKAYGNTQLLDTVIDSKYMTHSFTIDTDNLMPNWTILDVAGLTVTLNRQQSTCSTAFCDMSVDAIHIGFSDFFFAGSLLNGEIAFGHSYAVQAVPEASTYGMMLAGLGLVGFVARRRTRS